MNKTIGLMCSASLAALGAAFGIGGCAVDAGPEPAVLRPQGASVDLRSGCDGRDEYQDSSGAWIVCVYGEDPPVDDPPFHDPPVDDPPGGEDHPPGGEDPPGPGPGSPPAEVAPETSESISEAERERRGCAYFSGTGSSYLFQSAASNEAYAAAQQACTTFRSDNGDTEAMQHCTWASFAGNAYTRSCSTSYGLTTCTVTVDRCVR